MDPERVESLTLALASEARRDWRYASDLISRAFRENRSLGSSERRVVAERVYGLIRMHRRVDTVCAWLLRPRGRRLDDLAPRDLDRLRYLVYRVTLDGAPVDQAKGELERLGVDANALGRSDQALGDDPGLVLSYPDWIVRLAEGEVGAAEARLLLSALNERAPLCIRANTLRISRQALADRLAEEGIEAKPLALAKDGLLVVTRTNAFSLAAFKQGLFEVQDEASQLVAELVAPPPRSTVVDACAGAGGKTLALGAMLEGKGRVLALDVDERKLGELRKRSRRAGLSNVQSLEVRSGPPSLQAERVLCDAPCSGLGVLRRNPEARWRLTPSEVQGFPARQLAILADYAPLVVPRGRLVYATCTFTRAENEDVVERFLERHPDFELVASKEILGRERATQVGDGVFLRTWPHRQGTDGFFGAVLRRR